MTDIANLPERMRAMQDAFDQAPVDPSGGDELPPDGDYQALVHAFDFFESKSGDAYIKIEFEIQFDREHAGWKVSVIHNLEDAERIKWLKKNLATLGADVSAFDLSQVGPGSDLLRPLLDVPVELAVVTSAKTNDKGENYRNVYLNKRLGDPMNGGQDVVGGPRVGGKIEPSVPADTAGMNSGASPDDDPIPF